MRREGFPGSETTPCDALVLDACHHTRTQPDQVHALSDPRVSSALWAITTSETWAHPWEEMHHSGVGVRGLGCGRLRLCGVRGVWEISVFSTQFC